MRTQRPSVLVAGLLPLLAAAGAALGQAGTPDFTEPKPATPKAPIRPPEPGAPADPRGAVPGMVDLRPRFTKGQELRYVLEQDAVNSLKTAGKPAQDAEPIDQDQKLTQRIGLVMRVVDSGPEGSTLQVVYDSIRVRMVTPEGTAEFDSAKGRATTPASPSSPTATPGGPTPGGRAPATSPGSRPLGPGSAPRTTPPPAAPAKPGLPGTPAPTPPSRADAPDPDMSDLLAQIVGPMVGQTVTVKVDPAGNVTSVSGGEGLGGGLPGLGGAGGSMMPAPSSVANWLVGGVSGTKGQARVGESWTDSSSLAGTPIGGFRMTTTSTLQSANGGVASVRFTGHLEGASENGGPLGPVQMKDSGYSGTYQWDTRAGALRELTSDLNVAMDASLAGTAAEMRSRTRMKVTRQDAGTPAPAPNEPWKKY
jgi:hypothetical protein